MATCGKEVVCIGDVLALADLESGGYVKLVTMLLSDHGTLYADY